MKKLTTLILILALSVALLVGCAAPLNNAAMVQPAPEGEQIQILADLVAEPAAAGGVLRLKINPEIALHYDENGKVTKLEGRNPEGVEILKTYTGYAGKDTSQVLEELVELIGQAGYFVEEADGTARRIVLELDPGSQVPHDQFLQDMAQHVKDCVESKSWAGEREYDYPDPVKPAAATEPVPTEPAATEPAPAKPATGGNSRCPVCYDDDCDDGKYCDDYDDRKENEREAERRKNGTPCPTCSDYDCDDGKYCDDWDDRKENERENERRKNGTPCPTCKEYDCDDKYCDGD